MKKSNILLMIIAILISIAGTYVLFDTIDRGIYINNFVKDASATTAYVTKIEIYNLDPVKSPRLGIRTRSVISYSINGNKYENYLDYKRFVGSTETIYYNNSNPYDIVGQDEFGTNFLTFVISIFVIALGLSVAITILNKSSARRILSKKGLKIEAKIIGVFKEPKFNKEVFVIKCTWRNPENNTLYQFRSEQIKENPKFALDGKEFIDVYIDTKNPKRYYVDTTKIERK